MALGNVQLGKHGITENFILTLNNQFKHHDIVKIHVLKSARGEGKEAKNIVKKFSEEILSSLGKKYTAKIIGFTIVVKKWRKPRK
jgi:RNA-binding protein YhbY